MQPGFSQQAVFLMKKDNLSVNPIRAFEDNYIWCITDQSGNAAVVDPGDAEPVLEHLSDNQLRLRAILLTHHHYDHTDGVSMLIDKAQSAVPVFGPEDSRIECTEVVKQGDQLAVPGLDREFEVIEVPGHTRSHIAFYSHPMLFCGDSLFSLGCGRLFEGTAEQMQRSLARLADLPGDTLIYSAHEYTLSNGRFAQCVEPDNRDLADRLDEVRIQVAAGRPTLPVTLASECLCNPFLRAHLATVRSAAAQHSQSELRSNTEVFAVLRQWKDGFRG